MRSDSEYRRTRRSAYAMHGLCWRCDAAAVVAPGRQQCAACLESFNLQQRARYSQQSANLCRRLSCSLPATVNRECAKHWFIRMAAKSEYRGAWSDLAHLLVAQDFRCAYSGEALIPGANASVDHRTPRSRGGSSDLENLCWCTDTMNRRKWSMTATEFGSYLKLHPVQSDVDRRLAVVACIDRPKETPHG
jgi:5-methylcytosine-specific restriction endonuclease McrA